MFYIEKAITHGQSRRGKRSPEYKTWCNLKVRCYNTNSTSYGRYGAKGIRICDRWLHSFENFFADMGTKPTPKHSLDRYPDTKGNYEPSNCRWATTEQQSRNRSSSIYCEVNGVKKHLKEWADFLEVPYKRAGQWSTRGTLRKNIEFYLNKKQQNETTI